MSAQSYIGVQQHNKEFESLKVGQRVHVTVDVGTKKQPEINVYSGVVKAVGKGFAKVACEDGDSPKITIENFIGSDKKVLPEEGIALSVYLKANGSAVATQTVEADEETEEAPAKKSKAKEEKPAKSAKKPVVEEDEEEEEEVDDEEEEDEELDEDEEDEEIDEDEEDDE